MTYDIYLQRLVFFLISICIFVKSDVGEKIIINLLENEENFIKTFSEKFDDDGNEKEISRDLYESFAGLKLKVSSVLDENCNEFFDKILK
jgi:hypothetical protein